MQIASREVAEAGFVVVDHQNKPDPLCGIIADIDQTLTDPQFHSFTAFTQALFAGNERRKSPEQAVCEMGRIFMDLKNSAHSISDVDIATRRWITLWSTSGKLNKNNIQSLTKEIVQEAFPLGSPIFETIKHFQHAEMPIALVSASYREFVQAVAQRLDIAIARYNPTFMYDRNGNVIGMKYNSKEAERKKRQIRYIAQTNWGIHQRNILVVDDKPEKLTGNFSVASLETRIEKCPSNTWCILQAFEHLPQVISQAMMG